MFLPFSIFTYPFVLILLTVVGGDGTNTNYRIGIGIPGQRDKNIILLANRDNSYSESSSENSSELDLVNNKVNNLQFISKDLQNVQSSQVSTSISHNRDSYYFNSDQNLVLLSSNYGPGEMGTPIFIENPTQEQSDLISEGYAKHGFNQYVSDMISINRTLPDYRSAWCQRTNLHSRKLLPSSVIITFYNEAWSTLMRTIHSVLDRTPAELLSDIVIVDDFSNQADLGKPLEEYLKTLPKVKLIRLRRREGLIRARIIGAANAEAKVLTFLDSHTEVTEGWLEPLVDRITRNQTNVVAPIIDIIDPNTFEYRASNKSSTLIGSFSMSLNFRWRPAPDSVLKNLRSPDDPLPTPVIGLGMFSIHKDFFNYIGGFDESFDIYGGEALEISFKTYFCGGRVEIATCSHVGHLYKKKVTSSYPPSSGNFLKRNLKRLAAIWLDEYAKYHFRTIGNSMENIGSIENRLKIKNRMNCKSFDWYMKNVAYDHFNPKTAIAEGEIRSLAFGGFLCLDSPSAAESSHKKVLIWDCHNLGSNQHWYYTNLGELRRDDLCLDYSGEDFLLMITCHKSQGNQRWIYDHMDGFIIHGPSGKCLALESRESVSMAECEDRITLRWQMEHYNENNDNKLKLLDNKSFKHKK